MCSKFIITENSESGFSKCINRRKNFIYNDTVNFVMQLYFC